MLLWIMITVSLLFAWLGFKKGLFVMFATLFNLMFSIFISILSARVLLNLSSGYEHSGYYAAATIFLLFLLLFGVLEFFGYFYILKHRDDYFPVIFDKVAAPVFGFLCGYVICCLVVLLFCIMPCSRSGKMDRFCTYETMARLSTPGIRKVCNFLGWYSLHCFDGNSEREIDYLLELGENDWPDEGQPENPYIEAIEQAAGANQEQSPPDEPPAENNSVETR